MATAKTIQKGHISETIASVVLFVICGLTALALASWWQSHETPVEMSAPQPDDPESCEVYVLSVNVGDQPWVVLSNYEAEQKPDGTVEVKTTSKSNIQ